MTADREAAIRKALDQPLAEPNVGERLLAAQALAGLLAELAAARDVQGALRTELRYERELLAAAREALREACLHQGLPVDAPPERLAPSFGYETRKESADGE